MIQNLMENWSQNKLWKDSSLPKDSINKKLERTECCFMVSRNFAFIFCAVILSSSRLFLFGVSENFFEANSADFIQIY